jgi:DNA-binding transcriptional LysR family regulator
MRMKWDDRIGRRLRLKDLHTLQTVAEVGSMAKASERLALSQPAISKAVSDMEHVLGAPLLDRSSRGVALTECGRLLVERTRVVFDEITQGVSDIGHLSDPTRGTVKIGTTEPVAGVVSEIISRLASKYPRLSYDVMISDLDTLIGELRQRTRDVVVTRWAPPPAADDLAVQTLFKSSLAVMAAQGHPLLRRRKLSLGDLMEERWTLSPPESFLGRVVVGLFDRRKLPLPATVVTTISIHMRLNLLASGDFLTILPAQMLRSPSNRAWLRALDVDLRDSSQPIASITLKKRRVGGAVRLFEQASIEACKTMARAT